VKLLLDTHTLLWALYEPGKLSSGVRQLLENPKNTRLVSAASLWEIAIKHKLGRLALGGDFLKNYRVYLRVFLADELCIEGAHVVVAPQLPTDHKDPFDRILAAQSQVEAALLLTDDPKIKSFGVQTFW
jgi:PIN domain nuclease of toxin-antitoxin system